MDTASGHRTQKWPQDIYGEESAARAWNGNTPPAGFMDTNDSFKI
jgi:hypothetical protein